MPGGARQLENFTMTRANQVTIARILLIPVYIGCAAYYARSVLAGEAVEAYRWAAIVVFTVAAASDGLDGYLARHYNQHSRLGRLLDPLADKGLLLSGIITLSVTPWPWQFPLWFPLLVVSRDVLCIAAAFLIHHVTGRVDVCPHWTGKLATFFQMCAIGWVMLGLNMPHPMVPTVLAGIFTFASGMVYLKEGIRQLRASEQARPDVPR